MSSLKDRSDPAFYADGVLKGDVAVLSRAITLIESQNENHRKLAQQVLDKVISATGRSFRLGITGVPGVGKSTFIESFGKIVTREGHKLAVLAVDPSSSKSKGSILGDKTRMETLSVSPNVYIRPSPSGGALGGVTRMTYETILLCEAAGFDFIIIETVGVGQSEIAVSRITDFFLLLMLAGAGDELQGIKRGIMEMADALVITKADGNNTDKAKAARSEYAHAMHLLQAADSGWIPRVLTCSSVTGEGLEEIWKMITEYRKLTVSNNYFVTRRKEQQMEILKEALNAAILKKFYQKHDIEKVLSAFRQMDIPNPFKEVDKLVS
jgi:LAO/AO transport system kinase